MPKLVEINTCLVKRCYPMWLVHALQVTDLVQDFCTLYSVSHFTQTFTKYFSNPGFHYLLFSDIVYYSQINHNKITKILLKIQRILNHPTNRVGNSDLWFYKHRFLIQIDSSQEVWIGLPQQLHMWDWYFWCVESLPYVP